MKNREKWRLIIQEAKAHPELWHRGERRKKGRRDKAFSLLLLAAMVEGTKG
jgi:hypothetical protein